MWQGLFSIASLMMDNIYISSCVRWCHWLMLKLLKYRQILKIHKQITHIKAMAMLSALKLNYHTLLLWSNKFFLGTKVKWSNHFVWCFAISTGKGVQYCIIDFWVVQYKVKKLQFIFIVLTHYKFQINCLSNCWKSMCLPSTPSDTVCGVSTKLYKLTVLWFGL